MGYWVVNGGIGRGEESGLGVGLYLYGSVVVSKTHKIPKVCKVLEGRNIMKSFRINGLGEGKR